MDENVNAMLGALAPEHRERLLRHLLSGMTEEELKKALAEANGPDAFRDYLTRDEAMMIADTFVNFDGTQGPKWADPDALFRKAKEAGVPCEDDGHYNRWAFFAAANMIFSDFGGVLRQVIDGERMTRLCLQMARAWLNDPDKGDRNIRWYLQL